MLRLMCILDHLDDESLGIGGILTKYAEEGIETFLPTVTRGKPGRFDDSGQPSGTEVVGKVREAELIYYLHQYPEYVAESLASDFLP